MTDKENNLPYPVSLPSPPPRPSKGVEMFSPAANWESNVIVGSKNPDWDLYCFGYKQAADAIVIHFMERRITLNDYSSIHASLAYPVIFLYRHYLELRFKELFIAYGYLLGESIKVSKTHKLIHHWKKLLERSRRASTEHFPEEIDEDIEVITRIVEQFDKIDPGSLTFRYPADSTSIDPMPPPIEVSLSQVKEAMEWVAYLLDGWSVGVYESIAARNTTFHVQ